MEKNLLNYLKGTTTIGLVCREGTILATDTRATMGYLVASKWARKVYPITNHIGTTVAGGVADTEKLVELLRAEANYYLMLEGAPISVRAITRLTSNILHSYRLFPYLAVFLVGGVDANEPKMYFIEFDGSLTEEEMVASGSGSPIAYGVLESEFKNGMLTKEALPIAVKALRAATKRDIGTGSELMIAVITRAGYKELSPEEIKQLA